MGASFSIIDYSDAPDVRCEDKEGNSLNIEVTLTEDQPGDIKAALGRSAGVSLEELKKLAESENNPLNDTNLLQGNVAGMIADRIQAKLTKDYGSNTALVIRDSSPIGWNWNLVTDQVVDLLDLKRNPYDKGIWVISHSKDKYFRLL